MNLAPAQPLPDEIYSYLFAITPNETVTKLLTGITVVAHDSVLMGFFYKYVANSMTTDFAVPEAGKLTPYMALVFFCRRYFSEQLCVQYRADVSAVCGVTHVVCGVFQRVRPRPFDGNPGRHDLECRYVVQHFSRQKGQSRYLVRARTGLYHRGRCVGNFTF